MKKDQKPDTTSGLAPLKKMDTKLRLSDKLYGFILDRILSGELQVGDRLPSEHEIVRQYEMSRPVVREALLRLRADGLITAHQGLGTFVTHQPEVRIKSFDDAGNVPAYLRAQELRQPIEGESARLAALRRTRTQLKAIETAHRAFVQQVGDKGLLPEADLAFHMSVARASGNELYVTVLESLLEPIQGFMRLALNLTRTGSTQRAQLVIAEHEAIFQAIQAQDGEQARTAMLYHLTQARSRLVGKNAG